MPSVPKIGMRLIKTAVAVFLCFLVDFFRDGGTPFYSAIAAILCMQPELGSSLKVGKERIIATIIGGIVGMAMLAFERYAVPIEPVLVRYLVISNVHYCFAKKTKLCLFNMRCIYEHRYFSCCRRQYLCFCPQPYP